MHSDRARARGPLKGHTDNVVSVAFSPDGRTLASASWDKMLRLWDARTHKALGGPLMGHKGYVAAVAFSPDGRTLASASYDDTLRLWEGLLWRSPLELQRQVCRLVGTGLSRSEWAQYAPGIPHRDACS